MDNPAEKLEEGIGFLKRAEIFGRLSPEELKAIVNTGRIETHAPGSTIFKIGDPSDAIYVIKSGVVEICRAKGDREKMVVVAYLGESDLKYFDLPTVIQTLATSERTGTLTITDQLEGVFARIYFEAGKVLYAELDHLKGEEAFYQLFQSPMQDAFTFKGGLPPVEFKEEEEIATTTMGLLMEAARQQDELKVLKESYADPNRVFRPQSETLPWNDEETEGLAQEVWARLHRRETIDQMAREIPVCQYRIYKVLSLMEAKGLAA